jgi:alkyldihydroxyacetonephosphate synthase
MLVLQKLRAALGDEKVITDPVRRETRRHDYWMLSQLDDLQGRAAPAPACIVVPEGVADVVSVVDACRQTNTPLVPYGLGSGVCGGVLVTPDTVLLDMGGMKKTREVDSTNLLATFDAGVRGSDAEALLAGQGLTLGHYPQSIGVSTVGGWVATRAAGQFSTGYGNIEDVLFSLEAVLPNGEIIETRRTPRASAGMDLRQLLLGSEGTLGVVTGVTFSVRRQPEKRVLGSFHVATMDAGFEIQRAILQSGYAPVVLRQYDNTEAERMFSGHTREKDSLLLVVHEGPAARVDADAAAVAKIAESQGAVVGAKEATEHWWSERNHVPSFRQFIENGVVVDTIEIAATWDRISGIYRKCLSSLGEVSGLLTASAHSSHGYRSGINLYFTFAAQPSSRGDLRATYLDCWRRVMQATLDGGGGIAHHHGIGRVRKDFLAGEVGAAGIFALRAVKRALDPTGFMNPGALLPDEPMVRRE